MQKVMVNVSGGLRAALWAACVSVWAPVTAVPVAHSAGIAWERTGAFQNCLDARVQTWVKAKAELVVNEDPAAGDVSDLDVAMWAIEALKVCEVQAGNGDPASEHRFMKYMANWRQYIDSAAEDIRRIVPAD